MTTLTENHFGLTTPPPPKPTFSARLRGLFGKVAELTDAESQRKIATYGELVQRLAAVELGSSENLPDADEIRSICEASGNTPESLQESVIHAAEIQRCYCELASQSEADEALASIDDVIARETAEFDQAHAAFMANQDLRAADRRELATEVERFSTIRNKLHRLCGEHSADWDRLSAELQSNMKQERNLRTVTGGNMHLSEKYITGKFEDSKERIALHEHNGELKRLEKLESSSKASPGTSAAARKITMLSRSTTELERAADREEQRYEAGTKVAVIRKERERLVAEREQAQARWVEEIEG